ncbi:MAG TPA: hypothetical protein VLE95_02100 [Chlamydiales bacterium]|nr:hypothetical protein [Chlamydiales bacterium]
MSLSAMAAVIITGAVVIQHISSDILSRLPELKGPDLTSSPVMVVNGVPPLHDWEIRIEGWVESSGAEELEDRKRAAEIIKECFLHKHTSLDLTGYNISSLPELPPHLEKLILCRTKINSFIGMPYLPNLKSLDLSYAPIRSFEGMPSLPSLETLDLFYTPIDSFIGMPLLHNLEILDLGCSQIGSFHGMPDLPNLKSLELYYTNVSSLSKMPQLIRLERLNISDAKISSLEGMPFLPNLNYLKLDESLFPSIPMTYAQLSKLTIDCHTSE